MQGASELTAPVQPTDGPPGMDPAFLAAGQYAEQVTADLAGAMVSVMCGLGDRLGLFAAMAALGPCTSDELAGHTGLDERYLREWLHCLAAAGYLEADPVHDRFALPGPLAMVLASGSAMDLSGGYALLLAMTRTVDVVAAAFRAGEGVTPDAYPDELYLAMERMSRSWLDTLLVEQWLPAVAGLAGRLTRGGRVVDIGCGGGRALIRLAQAFPRSEFLGIDLHPSAIDRATAAVERAGMADRIQLGTADAAAGLPGPVDLVTLFDVLHDSPRPEAVLRAARAALAADGTVLILESRGAATPLANSGPAATILFATSVLYCLPASRTAQGSGTGTLGMTGERIGELATGAGFGTVREVPVHHPFHALYELRP